MSKRRKEIQEILEKASEEQFVSGEVKESILFETDNLSNPIKTNPYKKVENFIFELDEDINLDKGHEILDLLPEMMESKVKKTVGFVLIYSKKKKKFLIFI